MRHDMLNVEAFRHDITYAFQQTDSVLRPHVMTETIANADGTYFPVVGESSDMVQRAGDGEFPFASNTNSRVKVSLTMRAAKERIRKEDIQISQIPAREAALQNLLMKRNYRFDQNIITALNSTTYTHTLVNGSYFTFADFVALRTAMRNSHVPAGDEMCFAGTPAAYGQMFSWPEFTSGDYMSTKTLANGQILKTFMGVTLLEHENLPGAASSSATCFMFHKRSVGHALAADAMSVDIEWTGSNKSWVITVDLYDGAALIQPIGVRKFTHDDTQPPA